MIEVGSVPDRGWIEQHQVGKRSDPDHAAIGEAEQLGLKILNTDFSLTSLEDYAIFAKLFDHKTNNERHVL